MGTTTVQPKTTSDTPEYIEYKVEDKDNPSPPIEIFVECFDIVALQKYVLDSTLRVTMVACTRKNITKKIMELYDVPPSGLFFFNGKVWQRVAPDKINTENN